MMTDHQVSRFNALGSLLLLKDNGDGTYTLGWFEAQVHIDDEWFSLGEHRQTWEEALGDIKDHMSRQTSIHVYRIEPQHITLLSVEKAEDWMNTPGCACRPVTITDGISSYVFMADWFDCPVHGGQNGDTG